MLTGVLCRELPSLFSAVPDNLTMKLFRQSIQKVCDSIERRESVSGDQCIRNRGIFEDINVEIHSWSFFDKFIESCHHIARFILRPVKLLDVRLKKGPIGGNISREKLDSIFDIGGAITGKASAALSVAKAEVFAFNVPLFEEFGDVFVVKLHRSRLPRMRHSRSENAGSCRWRCVGTASAAGVCIRHC